VTDPDKKEPSFEDAVKRLSDIVQRLERGDLPLEESLALFEEGVGLSKTSQTKLDNAQKRVDELLGVDKGGKPATKTFEMRGHSSEPGSFDREDR
jgi:exodeoxyribonuclease VII small subunit